MVFLKDTEILMYKSGYKKVQDIKVGDLIQGDNNRQRTVCKLHTGKSTMYKITHLQTLKSYIVDRDDVLLLMNEEDKVLEITVKNFMLLPKTSKDSLYGFSKAVDYPKVELYDSADKIGSKISQTDIKVPAFCKYNNVYNRLLFLQGIFNTLGFSIYGQSHLKLKNRSLADDVYFIINSLGLLASISFTEDEYYQIKMITGEISIKYPKLYETRIGKEKIKVELVGYYEYYGFYIEEVNYLIKGFIAIQ